MFGGQEAYDDAIANGETHPQAMDAGRDADTAGGEAWYWEMRNTSTDDGSAAAQNSAGANPAIPTAPPDPALRNFRFFENPEPDHGPVTDGRTLVPWDPIPEVTNTLADILMPNIQRLDEGSDGTFLDWLKGFGKAATNPLLEAAEDPIYPLNGGEPHVPQLVNPIGTNEVHGAATWDVAQFLPVAAIAGVLKVGSLFARVLNVTDEVTGATRVLNRAAPALDIEATFLENSRRVADRAHAMFKQGVADGSIPYNPKLPFNTQAGRFADDRIRTSNVGLRDDLGLDASTVRINQRLYAPDGSYSVPDLHFPLSGNSIDYSYQLKTITTPQIQRILSASPNGTITIVPPSAVRPIYVIGR